MSEYILALTFFYKIEDKFYEKKNAYWSAFIP